MTPGDPPVGPAGGISVGGGTPAAGGTPAGGAPAGGAADGGTCSAGAMAGGGDPPAGGATAGGPPPVGGDSPTTTASIGAWIMTTVHHAHFCMVVTNSLASVQVASNLKHEAFHQVDLTETEATVSRNFDRPYRIAFALTRSCESVVSREHHAHALIMTGRTMQAACRQLGALGKMAHLPWRNTGWNSWRGGSGGCRSGRCFCCWCLCITTAALPLNPILCM